MKNQLTKQLSGIILCLGLACAMAVSGCATTMQARKVETAGFLKNYEQLRPGQGDEAQMIYVNARTQFGRYRKLIIDPVAVYGEPQAAAEHRQELQALANYYNAALREQLGTVFQLTSTPGPDVLRLRTAITGAGRNRVALDVFSTLMPMAVAVSTLKVAATGKHSFVGDASTEAELLDSRTNERLMAGVDARSARKWAFGIKFGKWKQAQAACDYWAERLRVRLEQLRSQSAGSKP